MRAGGVESWVLGAMALLAGVGSPAGATSCPVTPGGPSCTCTERSVYVSPPGTGTTTIKVVIEVQRPLADMARALDPQSWDECSRYFPRGDTYLAGDPNHDYPIHHGQAVPGPPKPLGATWGVAAGDDQVLFEDFSARSAGHRSEIHNLLGVTSVRLSDHYFATYKLYRRLLATLDGIGGFNLIVDDGHVEAREEGSVTVVESKKRISFDDQWSNTVTHGLFAAIKKDLSADLRDIACCQVP